MCGEWQPTQLFTVDLYVVDMYEKERRAIIDIRDIHMSLISMELCMSYVGVQSPPAML